jgi:hypothetical protein
MTARKWALVRASLRAPQDPTRCVWSDFQGPWEKQTPIGQAHVATNAGITDDYNLSYTDNLYVNFGGSSASNGPFSGVGNLTLSYSWGISGGATLGGTSAGYRNYLGSQYLWQRYFQNGAASCPWYYYKEQSVQGFQNVLTEGDAGFDPFGGCKDRSPNVILQPHSHWGYDRGKAQSENIGTTVFGMGIVAGDGFTSDVNQTWTADSSAPYSYICGYGNPTTASVLWDTLG